MAIGDSNRSNNSNSRGVYETTCYSRYRFKNGDTTLGITYKLGLMVLEIGTFNSQESGKTVPTGIIYLSPIKALLLAEQISAFIDYRDNGKIKEGHAFGVNAGMGEKITYIGFSTNDNKENIITIGKFDGNGTITESTKFTFNKSYNYALEWKDIDSNDLTKIYNDDIELTMLRNTLIDFGRNMSGASGYANIDTARYDTSRNNYRMDMVLDKLGIERRSNTNSNYGQSNNYLSNASSSSRSTSFEEVEDLLL